MESDEGKLLRLYCPFCGAETPLWLRPEDVTDEVKKTEWERWLETACRECGKLPADSPLMRE